MALERETASEDAQLGEPGASAAVVGDLYGERPALTRRALLQRGTLAIGGLSAATIVAACAAPPAPGWSFGPTLAPAAGASAGTSATPAPSAPAPATATPALPTASGTPTPSASAATGHDPSPADFAVPPPYRPHVVTPVEFKLTAHDGPGQAILINADTTYNSMNFDGQVPAPTLRVTEGDVVRFTLTNAGAIPHSIDFHAAQTPWSKNYQEVAAGSSFTFEWTARHPGVFMYHCGTPPVLMHIGDGMYGAIIVDPKAGRPKAREYVVVQSEFYGSGGDYNAMMNNPPDVVCFNGQAFRYKTTPLKASVGELVRFFVMNAGPSSTSAFHVIGELFDLYEPEGNPANRMGMHQTIVVPPGDGAMVELTFDEAGTYPFVTHKFSDAERGAVGAHRGRVSHAAEETRVDRWLCAVRLAKTRPLATRLCEGGHVLVNGSAAKPSTKVRAGDRVEAFIADRKRIVEVMRPIESRVGAAVAATCYVDHSPPVVPEAGPAMMLVRGEGRPSKRRRREFERLRRGADA